jgi:alkylhydroperoxidase family enzyme
MDINAAVGSKQNLGDDKIAEIAVWPKSALFSPAERAALAYAEHMCQTHVDVPDDVFAALRAHFNENQIVELTAAIAYENYRARFNHALDIPSDNLYTCAWKPGPMKKNEK